MTEYTPPSADMLFTLQEIANLEELASLPQFSDIDFEVIPDLLDEASRFFSEVIAPTNVIGDRQGCVRHSDGSVATPPEVKEAYTQYAAGGWGSISFDPEFGGGGFPWVIGVAIQEMLTASNMALSLNPMLTQGAIHALHTHGNDEQKQAWLPRLISGEWTGTMNLTEPQAGSDLGAVNCRAEHRDDDTYAITGQKIFITWGEHDVADNIVHLVLARTPDAPAGSKGLSLFLVPKFLLDETGQLGVRNDLQCISIEHKLGIHGSPTCIMDFEGAIGYLIGEEQQGMKYMFTMMNQARLLVGVEGLAVSDRAFQQAVKYARDRLQGHRPDQPRGEAAPIIEHPDIRRMLMTMKANIEAMRSLIYFNASCIDFASCHPDADGRQRNRELADLLTPLSKAWSTDLGNELTSLAVQVHGGMGFIEETGAAQHYRDIRIAAIYEGTNGIQAIDLIGRKLAMRGGEVVAELIAKMEATVEELGDGDLKDLAEPLATAIAHLKCATRHVIDSGAAGTDDGLAGATPYLRLMATTTGGWLMARSAIAAQQRDASEQQLANKIATARFFCHQLLPQTSSLLAPVTASAQQLYESEL